MNQDNCVAIFGKVLNDSLNEIYVFDAKTLKFLEINRGACEHTGFSAEELRQMTPLDICAQYDKQEFEAVLLPLQAGQQDKIAFESIHRKKDGSSYPVEVHLQLTEFRAAPAYLAIVLDLSALKRSYQLLKENERRLSAILDNAVEAIVTTNHRGVVQSFNPAAEKIFGYREDEIVGQNVSLLMPPPYADMHDRYIDDFLESGVNNIIGIGREIVGRRKDGRVFPLEISVTDITINNQTSFTGVMRDLSERKENERQLRLRDDQMRLNQERFAKLSRINIAGELAAGIAHEINQPLTAISTYAQACNRLLGTDKIDRNDLQSLLQKINDQTQRASTIIRRLRALIKQHDGLHETVDINELINEVIGFADFKIRLHQIRIETLSPPSPTYVDCDFVQIQQVILNLLYNAVDAMASIEAEHKKIILRAEKINNSQLRITVRDFGIGLTKEQRDQIFLPFYTTKPEGMGIGLALSQSIIEAHGGQLFVSDDIDQGAEFYFMLPLAADE